jgi:IS5 family transposase
MKQMTFADAEYAGKRKQTRKELFLIEMDRVVPWKGLIALIEPHYPKGEGGRPSYPLMVMLRVHLCRTGSATATQQWRKRCTRRLSCASLPG